MNETMNPRDLKRLAAGADERSRGLADSIAGAAAQRGLLDVAVGETDSPLGKLLIAVTPRGVARVAFEGENRDDVLDELARRISPRVLDSARATDEVRRQLSEYFERDRRTFEVAVDWSLIHGFATKTLRAARRIPYGRVATYGDLAERVGSPRAARAIGNALGSNPIPIVIPCHRVLRTGGNLGGYGGGIERKETLLRLEGALAS
jgi:methylated-DNA-[protein]-cysteine S-methyltransferase